MNQMWFWLVIGALSVGALACGGGDDAGPSGDGPIVINTPTVGPTRIAVRTATTTATGVPTKTPLTVCGTNPDPALPKLLQTVTLQIVPPPQEGPFHYEVKIKTDLQDAPVVVVIDGVVPKK